MSMPGHPGGDAPLPPAEGSPSGASGGSQARLPERNVPPAKAFRRAAPSEILAALQEMVAGDGRSRWWWAVAVLGFALSASVSIILVKVRRVEIALLVVVVIYGLIVYLRHRYAQRLASDANI